MKERRNITSPVLTMDEASRYLKIPKETLYKLVSQRRIPVSKYMRHNRFRQADLDAWVKKNTLMPINQNT